VDRLYGWTENHNDANSRCSQTALRRRLKVGNRCRRTKVQNMAILNMKPTNSGKTLLFYTDDGESKVLRNVDN
jgi:hypothetical protein